MPGIDGGCIDLVLPPDARQTLWYGDGVKAQPTDNSFYHSAIHVRREAYANIGNDYESYE